MPGSGVRTVIEPVETLQVSGLNPTAVGCAGAGGWGSIVTDAATDIQPSPFSPSPGNCLELIL